MTSIQEYLKKYPLITILTQKDLRNELKKEVKPWDLKRIIVSDFDIPEKPGFIILDYFRFAKLIISAKAPEEKCTRQMDGFHTLKDVLKCPLDITWMRIDDDFTQINYEILEQILYCFREIPDHAFTTEYLNFKICIHPATLTRHLNFLKMLKVVHAKVIHMDQVVIYKKKILEDPLYQAIPEGQYNLTEIASLLHCSREQAVKKLSAYQNQEGLLFSLLRVAPKVIWRQGERDLNKKIFDSSITYLRSEGLKLISLQEAGEAWLNWHMEEKTMNQCRAAGTKAVVIRGEKEVELDPGPRPIQEI